MLVACGARAWLSHHHWPEVQSLAASGRRDSPWRLARASAQRLCGWAERARRCATEVAAKWQGGVCACAHHLGPQALALPDRDRASLGFLPRLHRHAPGFLVIWRPMSRPCSPISPHAGRLRSRSRDSKEELGLDHYQVMSATAILRL